MTAISLRRLRNWMMRRGRRGAKERKNKIGLKKSEAKNNPSEILEENAATPRSLICVDKEQQALHNAFHAK